MDMSKQTNAQPMGKTNHLEKLTSAEMGKLWATYMGNSMSTCVLNYFLQHVENQDIKSVLENALRVSESLLNNVTQILTKENFPIPVGFTNKDVNLGAPRLFEDEFYLHYLKYTCKAGLSIYSIAVSLVTRKDVQDLFEMAVSSTVKLTLEIINALMEKGFMVKPPLIPTPKRVDFIKKKNYLNGFLGSIRPLSGLEIGHIHSMIDNNVTSKALLIAFSQVATKERVREFFIRGKEITNKHIETCTEFLNKEGLPAPILLDHLVSNSTASPFSDKLMVAHKLDMFSMKIRSYGEGLSLSGRRDLGASFSRFILDVGRYVEDAADLMIDQGWAEQPPEAVDRESLASE